MLLMAILAQGQTLLHRHLAGRSITDREKWVICNVPKKVGSILAQISA
jgi:hypothetical protein